MNQLMKIGCLIVVAMNSILQAFGDVPVGESAATVIDLLEGVRTAAETERIT